MRSAPLEPFGLYDPRWEHDACGIGFIARTDSARSHEVLELGLGALCNLEHRGAIDADGKSGDGAGVLTQLPYDLLAAELRESGITPPAADDFGLAQCFLPVDVAQSQSARRLIEQTLTHSGIQLLRWRAVPTNNMALGARALATKPALWQALVVRPSTIAPGDAWERALYLVRRDITRAARERALEIYLPSCSSRTVVYKGLMVAHQLDKFYLDLQNPAYRTSLVVFHQRFATNTMPTWELAQPFRMLSHNGEINTKDGNIAAFRAREPLFESQLWGDALPRIRGAISDAHGSDSSVLDNVLELLVRSGRDLRHSLSMMVPEAWEEMTDLDADLRAFYRYHAGFMSPWDGPAALCFSDGQLVGTALDRNGLRPARFFFTDDGLVVCASEVGAVPIDDRRIVRKGRLGPGEMLVVDTTTGEVFENNSIKRELARRAPYAEWLQQYARVLDVAPGTPEPSLNGKLIPYQTLYGYGAEDVQVILKPMARTAHEPVGSMGDDTPVGPLTRVGRPLYSYLRQHFAQVTNPPIDPLREKLVMSVKIRLGRLGNILEEKPELAHLIELRSPILRTHEFNALRSHPEFPSVTLRAVWNPADGADGLRAAIAGLQRATTAAINEGAVLVVITDRPDDRAEAPIPALLAIGAVHQHLIHTGQRALASLLLETGEARDVHQIACLIGNGAEAIHPFLALETVRNLANEERAREPLDPEEAQQNYVMAIEEGLRKIMSKMGISTLDSYHGAQLFEAVGLASELVDECLTGTAARLGGIGWADVAADSARAHTVAWASPNELTTLKHAGIFKWKKDGEFHAFQPPVIHALQSAVGLKNSKLAPQEAYRAYSKLIMERPPLAPRDMLRPRAEALGAPISLDEVEAAEVILRRFSTAAMSLGSTSTEAHSTISIAMTRLGGLSNSGEGGEDPARFGTESNSSIKQVASARFGVTPAYLMSARELQIKMAQGSKPGEGGQLPGHKVSDEIARIRHTTAGVTLISPPPHHDIYSIEDLAQLIFDLKQVSPKADVSVKLVAEAGVGTIAAGVVKAGADVVLVSGHSGGTGASPLSSIKNAGVSWELGLAETQQSLTLNGLRERVRLRTDGGLQVGRDIVVAAMLGADEYSFGTAALVAEGCLMARSCHTNTCPVGIATQRPDLRAKFPGTPESVMHFFMHLVEEVREILASIGARSLQEVIGRTELLEQVVTGDVRADQLDLSPLLQRADLFGGTAWNGEKQAPNVSPLNERLAGLAEPAAELYGVKDAIELKLPITNCDRAVGATLAGAIAQRWADQGLPDGSILLRFTGSAGQSFGAFAIRGMQLELTGEANDYVGKGLGGGEIIVHAPDHARYRTGDSTLIGNTVLYGATGGTLWAAGQAGERFAVRNSGATAVVEGVGDHGCEYMTGGLVVVLGRTGRNFGAGMTGGRAYVWDARDEFPSRVNGDLVTLDRVTDAAVLAELRGLIERHVQLTGSKRGRDLLHLWDRTSGQFWQVLPRREDRDAVVGGDTVDEANTEELVPGR